MVLTDQLVELLLPPVRSVEVRPQEQAAAVLGSSDSSTVQRESRGQSKGKNVDGVHEGVGKGSSRSSTVQSRDSNSKDGTCPAAAAATGVPAPNLLTNQQQSYLSQRFLRRQESLQQKRDAAAGVSPRKTGTEEKEAAPAGCVSVLKGGGTETKTEDVPAMIPLAATSSASNQGSVMSTGSSGTKTAAPFPVSSEALTPSATAKPESGAKGNSESGMSQATGEALQTTSRFLIHTYVHSGQADSPSCFDAM